MDDVIVLIRPSSYILDGVGNQIPAAEIRREVFVELHSITRREFFDAAHEDMKPEIMAKICVYDFEDEKIAELNGRRYTIYRNHGKRDDDRLELYLTRKAGVGCGEDDG